MVANAGVVDDSLNPDPDPDLDQNQNQMNLFNDDDSSEIQRSFDGNAPLLNSDDGFMSSSSSSFDQTGFSLNDPLFNMDNVNKYDDNSNNGNDNIFRDTKNVLLDDDDTLTNSNLFAFNPADLHSSSLPSSSECSSSPSSPPSRFRLRARQTNGEFCIRKDGTGIDFLDMEQVRKYWCSKTMYPNFLNIPVCRSRDLDLIDQSEVPDLVVPEEVRLQLTGYVNLDDIYHSEKFYLILATTEKEDSVFFFLFVSPFFALDFKVLPSNCFSFIIPC